MYSRSVAGATVYHYSFLLATPIAKHSLNWARDEKPDRQEMRRAAVASLKALGLERHQALSVSHRDGQPHVHVIANRVDPESGKAAGLSRSKLKLSKWAERYEREQGKIRCPVRERNNRRRGTGERVVDGRGHSGGRWRRERMSPQWEEREVIPAERNGGERERVAWQRAEERTHWEWLQRRRGKELGELERRSKREWSALYGRQERQREQLAAVRTDGLSVRYRYRDVDWYRLTRSVLEERLEQVREIDGEQAYEKMRRAVEKASQVERAIQPVRTSQFPSRKRPERRGPETRGTGTGLWTQPLSFSLMGSPELYLR